MPTLDRLSLFLFLYIQSLPAAVPAIFGARRMPVGSRDEPRRHSLLNIREYVFVCEKVFVFVFERKPASVCLCDSVSVCNSISL